MHLTVSSEVLPSSAIHLWGTPTPINTALDPTRRGSSTKALTILCLRDPNAVAARTALGHHSRAGFGRAWEFTGSDLRLTFAPACRLGKVRLRLLRWRQSLPKTWDMHNYSRPQQQGRSWPAISLAQASQDVVENQRRGPNHFLLTGFKWSWQLAGDHCSINDAINNCLCNMC